MLYFCKFFVIIYRMSQEIYKTEILPLRIRLLDIARNILGNREEAEDAVQEVLLKFWLISDSLGCYANPAAMAVTAMKNLCLDKLKVLKREQPLSTEIDFGADTDNPYYLLESKNTEEILMWIIERLPKLQQMIIKMKDIQLYEVEEIANITGTAVEAVRMNLSRARKKVREEYLKITAL